MPNRSLFLLLARVVAIGAAACSSVGATPAPGSARGRAAAMHHAPGGGPYAIALLDDAGRELVTHRKGDRFYVMGDAGARYSVRVTNPTDRRIEAVISIDGLDVIDGEDADYVGKRGYIVAPHDTLVVEGFRTSDREVAAFRFSAVADSYAERKGKGRNVGVIGVAIFEERAPAIVATPRPLPRRDYRHHGHRHRGESRDESAGASASSAPAPRPAAEPSPSTAPSGPSDRSASLSRSAKTGGAGAGRASSAQDSEYYPPPSSSRPGLGTAWGEQRVSQVSFTTFERKHDRRPDALAELRYDDVDGLAALGIPVRPYYDPSEMARRDSADPFPATRYAQPPR